MPGIPSTAVGVASSYGGQIARDGGGKGSGSFVVQSMGLGQGATVVPVILSKKNNTTQFPPSGQRNEASSGLGGEGFVHGGGGRKDHGGNGTDHGGSGEGHPVSGRHLLDAASSPPVCGPVCGPVCAPSSLAASVAPHLSFTRYQQACAFTVLADVRTLEQCRPLIQTLWNETDEWEEKVWCIVAELLKYRKKIRAESKIVQQCLQLQDSEGGAIDRFLSNHLVLVNRIMVAAGSRYDSVFTCDVGQE